LRALRRVPAAEELRLLLGDDVRTAVAR